MSYLCHGCGTVIEDDIESFCHKCKSIPEPSADVVERSRTWIEWRYAEHCRADDKFVRLSDAQALIEAEVQRRTEKRTKALETTLKVINEQAQMNGCIKGTLWADDITTLVELIEDALEDHEPSQAVTQPQQHDPDDWPEPGMEKKR